MNRVGTGRSVSRGLRMRRFLRLLLGLTACGVLAFSGLKLYGYYSEAHASSIVIDTLAENALVYRTPETETALISRRETVIKPEQTAAEDAAPVETSPISVDFEILRETNADIIGWLYCEDTPINYPIVQGADNDYYLHRLPDGTYNSSGTIFMDCRSSADFSDLNTIVYGHNMMNDSMFGTLPNYKEQSYYEEHPFLWLLTPDADYKLELIAGYVTGDNDDIYSGVQTAEELLALVEYAADRSTFSSDLALAGDDRVVTLSTCSYEYENARYVLLGRLTEAAEEMD